MCLLDTTDGALMMTLYTSTPLARDTIAILYYSIVLTAVTVLVATFIGVMQLLTLVLNVASPKGAFWDGVSNVGDHYDIVGGAICATFVVSGIASAMLYKPWRRRIDRRRRSLYTEVPDPGNSPIKPESLDQPPETRGSCILDQRCNTLDCESANQIQNSNASEILEKPPTTVNAEIVEV
jgi:high-affinity nickel-transport protein